MNANILQASVIDENLPSDNPDRKSEADVLEIFVRVNREGTPLSRSDLTTKPCVVLTGMGRLKAPRRTQMDERRKRGILFAATILAAASLTK